MAALMTSVLRRQFRGRFAGLDGDERRGRAEHQQQERREAEHAGVLRPDDGERDEQGRDEQQRDGEVNDERVESVPPWPRRQHGQVLSGMRGPGPERHLVPGVSTR